MPSFWDFFIPQAQAGIEGAKTTLNEGDTPERHEWATRQLDSAKDQLDKAKEQTLKQIAERDSGSYNPEEYSENGSECSKYSPRHPDYQDDRTSAAERRAAHRRNLEEDDDY
jgi:hypothetical protein